MTKKSELRLERDRQDALLKKQAEEREIFYATNTMWDDVNSARAEVASFFEIFNAIKKDVNDTVLLSYATDLNALVGNVHVLASDINQYSKDLDSFSKEHAGKFGGVKDDKEHAQALQLFSSYKLLLQRVDGTSKATFQMVLAQLDQARARMLAANSVVAPDSKESSAQASEVKLDKQVQ